MSHANVGNGHVMVVLGGSWFGREDGVKQWWHNKIFGLLELKMIASLGGWKSEGLVWLER